MFRTGAHFMIVVLVLGLLLQLEARHPPLRQLDEGFADFLARNSQRKGSVAPVTLVAINPSSLKSHPWPWTPLDFALFFQAANGFRPSVLATDCLLQWDDIPNTTGDHRSKLPQYKKILREHMLKAPKVLLGAQLGYPTDPQVIPPLEEAPLIEKVRGDVTRITEYTKIEAQPEEDFRLSSTIGFTNLPRGDAEHHSAPLLFRYRGQIVPSFVLQAVILSEQLTADDVEVEAGSFIKLADRVKIPINERGEMRVDFGSPRSICGLDELVLASAQLDAHTPLNVPLEKLRGKLLLLARTDEAAQTLQFSIGSKGSPGELFAAAIATIQNRSFLRESPRWVNWVIIAAAALGGLWAPQGSRWTVLAFSFLALALYGILAISVFTDQLISLPIVLPAGLISFIAIYRQVSPTTSRKR